MYLAPSNLLSTSGSPPLLSFFIPPPAPLSSLAMLAPLLSFASVVLFVSGTAASSVGSVYSTPSTNDKTSTTLGNGKSFQAGYINSNIAWQASGTLLAGGCVKPGGVLPKVSLLPRPPFRFSIDHFAYPSHSLAIKFPLPLLESWKQAELQLDQ